MSKAIKTVSPKGTAAYPWLTKADTRFNAEGVFKTGLTVSKEVAKPFQDKIKEAFIEEFGQGKLAKALMPWKETDDGEVMFNFKSKNKPVLYDSVGRPIKGDVAVGGGSTIKVSCAIGAWNAGGKIGATLYLNAVQIIDLQEYGSSPFTAEEGGYVAEDELEEVTEKSNEETPDF